MTVDDRAEPPDLRSPYEPTIDPVRPPDEPTGRLSFRTRLTAALVGVAILPLIGFGLVVVAIGVAIGSPSADPNVGRALLFAMAVFVILAIVGSYFLADELLAPLRSIAAARGPDLGRRPVHARSA